MDSQLINYFRREYALVRAQPMRYWAGLLILTAVVFIFPIRTGITRHLTVLLVAVCPGKPYDVHALRIAYVDRLRAYVGVKYVWGGENMLGVDCSGLVR